MILYALALALAFWSAHEMGENRMATSAVLSVLALVVLVVAAA